MMEENMTEDSLNIAPIVSDATRTQSENVETIISRVKNKGGPF